MNPWLIASVWLLLITVVIAWIQGAVDRRDVAREDEEQAAQIAAWREARSRAMDKRRTELTVIARGDDQHRRRR